MIELDQINIMAQPNFGYTNVGLGMGMGFKILQMWIGVGNEDLVNRELG